MRIAEKARIAIPWRDFQLVLVGAVALFILMLASEQAWFLRLPQLILSLAYVLYVPGYCLAVVFFPQKDALDGIERLGLSIGLSLAVVPVLALLLDRLPWGIDLWTILLAEYGMTAACIALALWRRSRLAIQAVYMPDLAWHPAHWWRSLSPSERRTTALQAGALLLASLSIGWILSVPSPKAFMTEFYILGKAGLAEDYPRETAVGDALTITVGITNRERDERTYRIEVWSVDPWDPAQRMLVGQADAITLASGQSRELPLNWRMPWPGDDQQVEFLLYTGDHPQPYRQLRLWLNVLARPSVD